jgi:hypothetical protein
VGALFPAVLLGVKKGGVDASVEQLVGATRRHHKRHSSPSFCSDTYLGLL